MPGLADTISKLGVLRAARLPVRATGDSRLTPLTGFGSNPGALVAKQYVPADLAPGAALVVVLHGCTQTADAYDRGSGWTQVADEQGLAVLYPEQVRANNANLCFNWFDRGDTRRDSGEAQSIRQMVEAMIVAHDLDRSHVFVTGLSAGGAMTSALLASYPDLFAGGAIIAGLPHGAAASMAEAFAQMSNASPAPAAIRSTTEHAGPWPTISVWHGDADRVVDASNADAILTQWRTVHGVAAAPTVITRGTGHTRRAWTDASGREVIEDHRIDGLGHGTPLSTSGPDACGTAGPHMLEAGISSTRAITRFWGLASKPVSTFNSSPSGESDRSLLPRDQKAATHSGRQPPSPPSPSPSPSASQPSHAKGSPGEIIERALRAAGLMR